MLIFSSSICIRSSLVEPLIVTCCCLIFISRVIDHHPAHAPLPSLFTPFILYLTFKPPSQILRARGIPASDFSAPCRLIMDATSSTNRTSVSHAPA
ncbi:hypothetical protein BHE90_015340 [Fusarium euwallaceae]|uniref:Uncharacterized protein n=4 Tax=Fusarium solani species complex TaxID=232080 RepID=A0A3M2RXD5_9HYPO|nr:hypothetical protein CDV36_010431 [Fusarium kuroshium]RSL79018.1 hypothetical protein CEP51_007719 [Fusarium floridanum]RSL91227.1 hypothetical protein CEP52_014330 [Fusarium oligoseptatum]RTE70269.1 hypothetical protein BHE90_015340 [Fusarium euwallaceae]